MDSFFAHEQPSSLFVIFGKRIEEKNKRYRKIKKDRNPRITGKNCSDALKMSNNKDIASDDSWVYLGKTKKSRKRGGKHIRGYRGMFISINDYQNELLHSEKEKKILENQDFLFDLMDQYHETPFCSVVTEIIRKYNPTSERFNKSKILKEVELIISAMKNSQKKRVVRVVALV